MPNISLCFRGKIFILFFLKLEKVFILMKFFTRTPNSSLNLEISRKKSCNFYSGKRQRNTACKTGVFQTKSTHENNKNSINKYKRSL